VCHGMNVASVLPITKLTARHSNSRESPRAPQFMHVSSTMTMVTPVGPQCKRSSMLAWPGVVVALFGQNPYRWPVWNLSSPHRWPVWNLSSPHPGGPSGTFLARIRGPSGTFLAHIVGPSGTLLAKHQVVFVVGAQQMSLIRLRYRCRLLPFPRHRRCRWQSQHLGRGRPRRCGSCRIKGDIGVVTVATSAAAAIAAAGLLLQLVRLIVARHWLQPLL